MGYLLSVDLFNFLEEVIKLCHFVEVILKQPTQQWSDKQLHTTVHVRKGGWVRGSGNAINTRCSKISTRKISRLSANSNRLITLPACTNTLYMYNCTRMYL